MTPIYIVKLGLVIWKTDVGAPKIDGLLLIIYRIILVGLSVQDKLRKVRFFEKTFLLANTSIEVVLGLPFLILSNVDMQFIEKKFA